MHREMMFSVKVNAQILYWLISVNFLTIISEKF